MSYGLTSEGFIAPRGADLLTLVRSSLETSLALIGIGTPDYDRDAVYGVVTAVMATLLGDLGEQSQALYDAFDVGNATGLQLDNLALVVGVTRTEATPSLATVTLTGTTGTVILAGRLVQGGGADGKARWRTTADVTLAAGTGSVVVECEVDGATVASIGAISTIVTPVSGWTAVSNPAAATPGDARESDDELRQRRQASLQGAGSGSLNALRADLLAIKGVTAAVCVDNDLDVSAVVQGLTISAHGLAVVVYPNTITTAQQLLVAEAIYGHIHGGIRSNGTGVVATITGADGFAKTIRFDFATTQTVNVAAVLSLRTGYLLADVQSTVEDAITDYFLALGVGDEVSRLEILTLIGVIEGIKGCTLTLDGGGVDIVPDLTEIALLGTLAVT